MGPQEFLAAVERLRTAPVVLCVGPSATLAELALARIGEGFPDGAERVGAGERQLREAAELVLTPSFFGEPRLVAAWRTTALSGQEGRGAQARSQEAQALLEVLEHPPREGTLFVWAVEADRRLGPVKRAVERGALLTADVGKDLAPWLGEIARREGAPLSPQAARVFIDSGQDIDALRSAVAVAAAATPDGEAVTPEVAQWAAPPVGELRVFALTDAILQRRPAGVALSLGRLLQQGEAPLGMLALVARQMRQLASVRAELAAGRRPSEIAQALGAHPFVAQKLCEVAPRWDAAAVRAAFHEMLRCDLALKRPGKDAVALELHLLRVAGLA